MLDFYSVFPQGIRDCSINWDRTKRTAIVTLNIQSIINRGITIVNKARNEHNTISKIDNNVVLHYTKGKRVENVVD